MFISSPKTVDNTTPPQKYDLPVTGDLQETRYLLADRMARGLYKRPVSGTLDTNPFKTSWDLAKAEHMANMELYQKSKLWSPKFRPVHFTYLYALPIIATFGFCMYIQYIQMPKNMMKLKEKYGGRFPKNEAQGTFRTWVQSEYIDDIYGDIFQDYGESEFFPSKKSKPDTKVAEEELSKQAVSGHKQMLSYQFNMINFEKETGHKSAIKGAQTSN